MNLKLIRSMAPSKRLNVNLSPQEHQYLKQLAQRNRLTMSELTRLAVDIIENALQDREKGLKLVAVNKDGLLVKEYVLPGDRRIRRSQTVDTSVGKEAAIPIPG